MVYPKNSNDIEMMRKSAQILKEVLAIMEQEVKEGVSTKHLDELAYNYIVKHNAKPSFLNYNGFPASICASVNDVVVHGIPSKKQILLDGDIIGIDVGVCLNGYHTDACRTFLVGNVSDEKRKLVEITKQSFFKGIEGIKAGSRVGDIGANIQNFISEYGYGIVTDLVGHAVGFDLHEDPSIPNVGVAGRGLRLDAGMTLAIEPMINMGTGAVNFDEKDGWTVRTKDGKASAHYENTVLITQDGVEILTI